MATLREWLRRFWGTFRKRRADHDLEEELRLHLELVAEAAQRAGHSPESAARLARIQAGGTAQTMERLRDQRGWPWLGDLVRDGHLALRQMRRGPLFSSVAILSLALGIGANTAIFSLVNALMLRPLPVRDPGQLVELLTQFPGEPRTNGFSWKVYEHFRDHNHVFTDLIAVSPARFQVSGSAFEAEPATGEYVVGRFFPSLGVEPVVGRVIGRDDDRLGAEAVAVISWSYWQRRFNRDRGIVGQRIVVSGTPVTIVGVAPRPFVGLIVGSRPDLWVPVSLEPLVQQPSARLNGTLGVGLMGRLKPGASLDAARAEMRVLDRFRVDDAMKRSGVFRQLELFVEPAGTGFSTLREPFARPLLVLTAVVGLLLLIACTNVAGLLLARSTARQREMAVRVSLGAARFRLVRQLLTESLLLSAAGGLLGAGLAYFGVEALVRILASGRPFVAAVGPLQIDAQPDARVLLFTAAVSLIAGVLFGLAPAWHASTSAPARTLREVGTAGDTRPKRQFGQSLIVAQVAVSLVLLSVAGLFVGHLSSLRNTGLGFDRESVLLVTLDPSGSPRQPDQLFRPYQDLLARLASIPGVGSATLSGVTPIHGAGASRFVNVEGVQEPRETREYTSLNWISPKYFETFRTPLVAGRDFQFDDEGRARVAIVNQAFERHYFEAHSAIGHRFTFEGQDRSYEIVGVVADAKYMTLHKQPPRTIYLNAFQESRMFSHRFSLRTSVAPSAVAADAQRTVREVLKTAAVRNVTTLADQVDASIVPERLVALLSTLFGGLGAALAGLGLYGLLAYTVARRVNEIGIRMALGATRRNVIRMVLGNALGMVTAGLIIGVPVAMWSQRIAAGWVENLRVSSAVPVAIAAAAMIGVGVLSAYLPARRASMVDPAEALRRD